MSEVCIGVDVRKGLKKHLMYRDMRVGRGIKGSAQNSDQVTECLFMIGEYVYMTRDGHEGTLWFRHTR